MNIELFKEIMAEFNVSDASSLKLKTPDFEIKLKKEKPIEVQKTQKTIKKEEKNIEQTNNYEQIKSPLVGTYYSSAEENGTPFTKIGDFVKKGQTICIVEAMKVLNEIKAPVDGKIVSLPVQNNTLVEYDSVLAQIDVQ